MDDDELKGLWSFTRIVTLLINWWTFTKELQQANMTVLDLAFGSGGETEVW